MDRMDIERNCMLFKLYGNYWLMLPAEIQEYILVLKITQDVIEERKRQQRKRICNEVRQYHKLKVPWGLGSICCKVFKCNCKVFKCNCNTLKCKNAVQTKI